MIFKKMHIEIKYLTYIFLSLITFLLIAKISYKLNLIDKPGVRKMHTEPTVFTGGFSLSLIYVFSIYIFDVEINSLNLILSIAFLISIVGLIDDKYQLNVGGKLSLQIIPILYLILFHNLNLNQIGDYIYFKVELNTFSIPFTLLCVILLINSTNYFDGLDGTLISTTLSVLSILYFLISDENVKLFLNTVLIPMLIFLCFNFSKFKLPKMFLGDSGSLLIGFIISFTLILLNKEKLTHPILLAWSISIFVYEFLSINLIRLTKGKNIFQSGTDHLHHILHDKTKSLFLVNFLLPIINIIFFIIGYISFVYINSLASLIIYIVFFIIFFTIRYMFCRK